MDIVLCSCEWDVAIHLKGVVSLEDNDSDREKLLITFTVKAICYESLN